jgi:hypothetical protein
VQRCASIVLLCSGYKADSPEVLVLVQRGLQQATQSQMKKLQRSLNKRHLIVITYNLPGAAALTSKSFQGGKGVLYEATSKDLDSQQYLHMFLSSFNHDGDICAPFSASE